MMLLPLLVAAAQPVRPPVPLKREDWIGTRDYPKGVLRNLQQGAVGFILDVDENGRATRCTIASSSGVTELDQYTCRLLESRARFSPAGDAAGRAVSGRYASRIRWDLIGVATLPVAAWSQVSRLTISGNGMVTSCATTNVGRVPAFKQDICKMTDRIPRSYLFMLRGGRGKSAVDVINETGLSLDSASAPAQHYSLPGRKVTSLAVTRFTISANGAVEDCRVVERRGAAASPSICVNDTRNSFAPDRDAAGVARARQATSFTASSFDQSTSD